MGRDICIENTSSYLVYDKSVYTIRVKNIIFFVQRCLNDLARGNYFFLEGCVIPFSFESFKRGVLSVYVHVAVCRSVLNWCKESIGVLLADDGVDGSGI